MKGWPSINGGDRSEQFHERPRMRPTNFTKQRYSPGARDGVLFYQVKHAWEVQNKDVLFIYIFIIIFVKYLPLFSFYFLFSDFLMIS